MSINYRAIQIIKDTIKSLNLDLTSYVVLTEVGSNNYLYTPIIPLLAGAKKVYAWTRDSYYGKGEEIVNQCLEIVKYLGLEDTIEFSINSGNENHIKEADIITNSGFIRPITNAFLKNVKPGVAIPLMFEAWEIRTQDLDLEACTNYNVKVAGTWENHPKIKVFNYVKELTLKMLFEAGYEISGNKFIIWSNDHFGEKAEEVLNLNNAREIIVTTDYQVLKSNIYNVDAILLFDYHETKNYFGDDSIFNLRELKQLNNRFGIVHLYGNVDYNYLLERNVNVYPAKDGKALNMTFTLAYVGLLPVLRLLTAGFKVGQESLQNTKSELSQPINF
ncbi:hypothetical protein [Pontimicrobium sp. MEBiC06410]